MTDEWQFSLSRRISQPPYSAPNALAAAECAVGDGRLRLVPGSRATLQFFRPSAFAELQTTAKPRTVGRVRVSGGLFARSKIAHRVKAEGDRLSTESVRTYSV